MRASTTRCNWATTNPLLMSYHDKEWGVPKHSDRLLFEMLNLEGAQAGLSWLIILQKRENYKKAFDNFNALKIVKYNEVKLNKLIKDAGIVRNKLKINAVIDNAKAFISVQKEFTSFDKYIWSFVNYKPIKNTKGSNAIKISETMSNDMKKRGFRFVGPTICYGFMQATGMVNDHEVSCYRRTEV